jgi:pimeloyl-ACP methyl ester carboxylesterase
MGERDGSIDPQRRLALLGSISVGALASVACFGCATYAEEPATPMPVRHLPAPCTTSQLLVLLPGAGSTGEDFVRQGFVAALRERELAAHIALPEAHPGYYHWRRIAARLWEDVLAPARQRGQRVWLAGISLGAYGALALAAQHAGDIEGVFAIAPWLGQREIQQAIAAAGGPLAWRANAKPRAGGGSEGADLDHEVWMWLAAGARAPSGAPVPVYLAYGSEDRFAGAHALMASLLDPERVQVLPGGHDWPVWRVLWQQWLARGLLAGGCGPRTGLIRSRRSP